MEFDENFEKIILQSSLKTDVDIVVTDNKEVIYYMGNADRCLEYLYLPISIKLKELFLQGRECIMLNDEKTINILKYDFSNYLCQAVYKLYGGGRHIVFYKLDSEFTEKEKFIMDSTVELINKFSTDIYCAN